MRPENVEETELSSFAADLRALRKTAGYPTFGELAASGDATVHELSDAARGLKLPTWPVVEAYVRACGGDPEAWRARHSELTAARAGRPSPIKQPTPAVPISVIVSLLLVAVAVFSVVARGNSAAQAQGGSGGAAAVQRTTADTAGTAPSELDASPPLVLSQQSALAPGTLIRREDNPDVSVVVGNARITYTDWDELVADYGPSPHLTLVADDVYDSLPTTPEAGTLVKEVGDRDIAAVDGPDRVVYPTWDALVADRGESPQIIIVPKAYFDGLAARPFVPR